MSRIVNTSKKLNNLKRKLNNLPWGKIGRIAQRSVHRNFDVGGRPRWARRLVEKPWPVLKKTGALRNGNKIELTINGVSIVNRVPYQAVHNFGYSVRNIKQRKYLKIRPVDRVKFSRVIINHLT